MSLFKEEHLECPFCHQDVPFILHHSINVGIHPEHKAKVLDSTLFRYQCPHCKQTDEVCYPTLYHDPENEIMIQVLWREEDFGQQMDKELQSLIEVMGQKNYRRREVFGYCELVEKIRVFDAGLDDFAISLIKTMHKIHNQEMQLFFHEKTDEGLCFIQFKGDELLSECFILEESAYETALQYAKKWQKHHEFHEYLRVDESYFYEDVMRALQQEIAEK